VHLAFADCHIYIVLRRTAGIIHWVKKT